MKFTNIKHIALLFLYHANNKAATADYLIDTSITCKTVEDSINCEDLVIPGDECGKLDLRLKLQYCNNENDFPIIIDDEKSWAKVDEVPVIDLSTTGALQPGECRSKGKQVTIDTCSQRTITSSLYVQGDVTEYGSSVSGWNFYKTMIPSSADVVEKSYQEDGDDFYSVLMLLSSKIYCSEVNSGVACEDLVIPKEECGPIDLKFKLKFCNDDSESPVVLNPEKTWAKLNLKPVDGLPSKGSISKDECREMDEIIMMNTCEQRWIAGSFYVKGHVDDINVGGWDFYETKIATEKVTDAPVASPAPSPNDDAVRKENEPREDPNDPSPTPITPIIKCWDFEDKSKKCEDLVVNGDDCGELPLKINISFCNENNLPIYIDDSKTWAKINTNEISNLPTKNPLLSKECRHVTETFVVDTCQQRWITSSFYIQGKLDVTGDTVNGWKYYQAEIPLIEDEPTASPSLSSSLVPSKTPVTSVVITSYPIQDFNINLESESPLSETAVNDIKVAATQMASDELSSLYEGSEVTFHNVELEVKSVASKLKQTSTGQTRRRGAEESSYETSITMAGTVSFEGDASTISVEEVNKSLTGVMEDSKKLKEYIDLQGNSELDGISISDPSSTTDTSDKSSPNIVSVSTPETAATSTKVSLVAGLAVGLGSAFTLLAVASIMYAKRRRNVKEMSVTSENYKYENTELSSPQFSSSCGKKSSSQQIYQDASLSDILGSGSIVVNDIYAREDVLDEPVASYDEETPQKPKMGVNSMRSLETSHSVDCDDLCSPISLHRKFFNLYENSPRTETSI